MAYSDSLRKVGLKRFVGGMAAADVDAHLLADSVYQEPSMIKKLDRLLKSSNIYRIRFMPYPFRDDILQDVGDNGKGFMILQSIRNAHGNRPTVDPENKGLVDRVRKSGTQAAIILAYGIRDSQRAQEAVDTGADGIIVGTSFVEHIGQKDYKGLSKHIRSIKNALS
jgi:tryptophan synthase alpha subunit